MAGHPDAQVRKCGDQVDAESEEISPWTEVLQTPGADISLHVWGCSFHTNGEIPYPRRLFDQWRKEPSLFFSASV